VLFDAAKRVGIEIVERKFTVDEAKEAREAFLSASSAIIIPVVSIDGAAIGNGMPGSVTMKLRDAYTANGRLS
jgi:D-alanine transaminase